MELRTFRAATMQEALVIVRRQLGPDAAILQTRQLRRRWLGILPAGPREIEVTASRDVNVPSRLPGKQDAGLEGSSDHELVARMQEILNIRPRAADRVRELCPRK